MSRQVSRDPARAGLPLHLWPPACLAAWSVVKARSASPFRKDGGGIRRTPVTILKSEKGLRRLFGFATRAGLLHEASAPHDLLTPELLDDYFAHLVECGNADRSIVGRFEELEFAFRLMYPGRDFRWITRPNGIPLTALLPMGAKARFVPSSATLLDWAMELYDGGIAKMDRQIRWAQVRDALLIGILATRAPRLRALSSLQLGKHMIRQPHGWLLDQDASITKTRIDLAFSLPSEIADMADRYVNVERREMLRGGISDAFWIGWQSGLPLKATSISGLVWRRTLERFGVGFGPHRFRASLVTTLAMENPSAPLDGPLLCGHSSGTALKSYNRSKAILATYRQGDGLRGLRAETERLASLAYTGSPHELSKIVR